MKQRCIAARTLPVPVRVRLVVRTRLKASRLLAPGVLAAWEPLIEELPKVAREAFFSHRQAKAWDTGWSE